MSGIDSNISQNHDDDSNHIRDKYYTALHRACKSGAPFEDIRKLVEDGGKEIVMKIDPIFGRTALHFVCLNNRKGNGDDSTNRMSWAVSVVDKLLEVGGKELVMVKDGTIGYSALYCEMINPTTSIEVVRKLLSVGGKDLVYARDFGGSTALHYLVRRNDPPDNINGILQMIVSVGGKDIVYAQDEEFRNTLHWMIEFENFDLNLFARLIETGGRKLLLSKDHEGNNPLHRLCSQMHRTIERGEKYLDFISVLIEEGGADIVKDRNSDGLYPFHCCISSFVYIAPGLGLGFGFGEIDLEDLDFDDVELKTLHNRIFLMLLHKVIEYDIKMEEPQLIGGLFSVPHEGFCHLWGFWDAFVGPALQNDPLHSYPLVLHGAIQSKAPVDGFEDIFQRFPDSILARDDGYLPVEKAIRDLDCFRRTKVIIDATANAQDRSVLNVAAEYGLQWDYFNDLSDHYVGFLDEIGKQDVLTGLYPFMLAASGDSHDLSVAYKLTRANPELVMISFDNEVHVERVGNQDLDEEIQLTEQNKKQRTR